MKTAQDYRDQAARAEALANDPRQSAEVRAELRSMARRWRTWAEQTGWSADQSDTWQPCAARERHTNEQVTAHIRSVLSQLKSRSPPEARRMKNAFYRRYTGPIGGLHLPLKTWHVLRRQAITTMDELQAAADRVQRFEGIGPKTARLIRDEIARVTAS